MTNYLLFPPARALPLTTLFFLCGTRHDTIHCAPVVSSPLSQIYVLDTIRCSFTKGALSCLRPCVILSFMWYENSGLLRIRVVSAVRLGAISVRAAEQVILLSHFFAALVAVKESFPQILVKRDSQLSVCLYLCFSPSFHKFNDVTYLFIRKSNESVFRGDGTRNFFKRATNVGAERDLEVEKEDKVTFSHRSLQTTSPSRTFIFSSVWN